MNALALLLVLGGSAFAADPARPRPDVQLRRAQTEIRVGWILTVGGPAVALGGYALALTAPGRGVPAAEAKAYTGTGLVLLGGAAFATGLVLLPVGHHHRSVARRRLGIAIGPASISVRWSG